MSAPYFKFKHERWTKEDIEAIARDLEESAREHAHVTHELSGRDADGLGAIDADDPMEGIGSLCTYISARALKDS